MTWLLFPTSPGWWLFTDQPSKWLHSARVIRVRRISPDRAAEPFFEGLFESGWVRVSPGIDPYPGRWLGPIPDPEN